MSDTLKVLPDDEFNQTLVSHAHPSGRSNPEPAPMYNLVVVGGGTAGLVAAIGGAMVGARTALVEGHLLGGDCLNYGCVPSKAVIRSSRAAFDAAHPSRFGLNDGGADANPESSFFLVMERMRRLRAGISVHDSVERVESFGVDVFLGHGRFTGPQSLEVSGALLRFKKGIIATGAKPIHPIIPGLKESGFLTNETIFSLTELPKSLAVIGGGPIGCELAQAFHRLGTRVTILERSGQFLPREDRDVAEALGTEFVREGIDCRLNTQVRSVKAVEGKRILDLEGPRGTEPLEAETVLVGVGRRPNTDGLNLEAANVRYDERTGVQVNPYLQTTNPRIYAAGDICFPWKFTHAAEATARIVVQNALFLRSKKHTSLTIPRCTFTDPEIAHIGLSEREAAKGGIPVDIYKKPFKDVDRAVLDGDEGGFIKILTRKGKDRILGATIVTRHAGEMISQITLALTKRAGLKTLAGLIHPYPTQSDAIKRISGEYYQRKFSPALQRLLKRWFKWRL